MQAFDYDGIGKRIRQVRKAKGWSQGTLAEKCGISLAFMGHIERGTRSMSLETFAHICSALGADAGSLLFGIPQPQEAVMEDLWKQPETKGADSYAMYIRIMKSVADIMSGA